MQFNGLSSDLF